MRRPNTGIYCLMPDPGVDWNTRPAIVAPEWNQSAGTDLRAHPAATARFSGCVEPEYEVVTVSGVPPAFANNVAFTIIVP